MPVCTHRKAHRVEASIVNLSDSGGYMADIRILCDKCGMPFRFLGLPYGASTKRPMVSAPWGEEACMPIEPLDIDGPVPENTLKAIRDTRAEQTEKRNREWKP